MKKEYTKPDLKLLVFHTEVIATSDIISGLVGEGGDLPENFE